MMRYLILLMSLVLLAATPVLADEMPEEELPVVSGTSYMKRVETFFFLVDESGSMGQEHLDTNMSKAATAKKLVGQLNNRIPELDYAGGLATFAPFAMKVKTEPFDRGAYAQAVDGLPAKDGFFSMLGAPTPLGDGFWQLTPSVVGADKPVAGILLSDGRQNVGRSAPAWAEKLVKNHEFCLHVIQLGDSKSGAKLLKQLATLEEDMCQGEVAMASDLLDNPAAQDDFLQKVLYTMVEGDAPGPLPVVPSVGDSDGDGVIDTRDQCPRTPKTLVVDDFGCPVPVEIELNINFDHDKAEVKPEFMDELRAFAVILGDNPEVNAVIEGHTDSTGEDGYNMELSQRRAQAVVDVLNGEFGIPASSLRARGYGEEQPVATNATAAGRAQNRRVVGILPELFVKK